MWFRVAGHWLSVVFSSVFVVVSAKVRAGKVAAAVIAVKANSGNNLALFIGLCSGLLALL